MTHPFDEILAAVNAEADEKILSALNHDPALREHVRTKPYSAMVSELAKPGKTIADEMTFARFVTLLKACAKVIDKGNELDVVKKDTVYNKELDLPPAFLLPSSQHLGAAHGAFNAEKAHLLHMAVGLAGEAAEMLEMVIKHVLGDELDVENLVEEAGDSTFYLQGLINNANVTMGFQQVVMANKVKLLGKRYKHGYSDAAAQDRADKAPGQ